MKKKVWKVIKIILIIILVLVIVVVTKVLIDYYYRNQDQKKMPKSDDELIGTHMYIEREDKENVDLNYYRSESDEPLPLVVNIHGGAFVAGDSDTLDTQSNRISKAWSCNVACVNYSLAKNGKTIPDGTEEICDTVKHFIANAEEYNVDPDNIFILGYSAGGYHAMASTLQLHSEGIEVKGQILCYAFLNDMIEQYDTLTDEQKKSIAPALFILAGNEPVGGSSLQYKNALDSNSVQTELITYDDALHGFIEENNPEYEKLHFHDSKSPEQEKMAREAEDEIGKWIHTQDTQ